MDKYKHLKEKARNLRRRELSLNDICAKLGLSKSTVYYWIRDLPKPQMPTEKQSAAGRAMARANKAKWDRLRQEAYEEGKQMIETLSRIPTFRDFVTMYIGEGTKTNRNSVGLCNMDATVMRLFHTWVKRLANPQRVVEYIVRRYEDHDNEKLRRYWAEQLGIDPNIIKIKNKSGSGKLAHRNNRSLYGIATIRVSDTYLRAKMEAWMDWIKEQW